MTVFSKFQVTPSNKKGPGQSINYEFDTIMHPKVEVTQVEDAASAAAASGASDPKDIGHGFFNRYISCHFCSYKVLCVK